MRAAQQTRMDILEPRPTIASDGALRIRLVNAVLAGALVGALLFSILLKPDPRGVGTHEQLLIFRCNFYSLTGLPCPFCGMTTAFAHMARGQMREALTAQPMGAAGFAACLLLLPILLGAVITGRDAAGRIFDLLTGKLAWIITGMLACAWLFKVATTISEQV